VDILGRVDRLCVRLERRGRADPSSKLYAAGVKEKLRQARFALSMMTYLEANERYGATSQGGSLEIHRQILDTVDDQIAFYCDCFWDFLRSAIDILAQLINTVVNLGVAERDVDFKRVSDVLNNNQAANPLTKAVMLLRRSRSLKALEKYRHCSTHRRHVYIQVKAITTTVTGRAGYDTTNPVSQSVQRYLCDNPLDLSPRVTDRQVVPFCQRMIHQVEAQMSTVVNRLC
jgi:hypothetical protein